MERPKRGFRKTMLISCARVDTLKDEYACRKPLRNLNTVGWERTENDCIRGRYCCHMSLDWTKWKPRVSVTANSPESSISGWLQWVLATASLFYLKMCLMNSFLFCIRISWTCEVRFFPGAQPANILANSGNSFSSGCNFWPWSWKNRSGQSGSLISGCMNICYRSISPKCLSQ